MLSRLRLRLRPACYLASIQYEQLLVDDIHVYVGVYIDIYIYLYTYTRIHYTCISHGIMHMMASLSQTRVQSRRNAMHAARVRVSAAWQWQFINDGNDGGR